MFEWKDNGVVKDQVKWMQIFSSSVDPEFNVNKRWDNMPHITSTTNEVPVHDDLKQPSNTTTKSKGNLKEGSKNSSPNKR